MSNEKATDDRGKKKRVTMNPNTRPITIRRARILRRT